MDVKICGVCRAEDARLAADAGATWLGVILAPGRTRTQTVDRAGAIFDAAPLRRAGVFVDAPAQDVERTARDLSLDAVQLHGDESPEYVAALRDLVSCEVWKVVRVRDPGDLPSVIGAYAGSGDPRLARGPQRRERTGVDAVLLDGWSPDAHGGVGVRFDWAAVARVIPRDVRVIVAGGLTPDNVGAAVSLLRPAMVDVSSGVEEAPGRKSPGRVHAFIAAARGVKET